MSVTVVGSIAFDAVQTPHGGRERMLGGAAVHFSLAASFFDEVRVVGPVGDDFGEPELAVPRDRELAFEQLDAKRWRTYLLFPAAELDAATDLLVGELLTCAPLGPESAPAATSTRSTRCCSRRPW